MPARATSCSARRRVCRQHVDLSTLDGSSGFALWGEAVNDLSGWSVASAGDVNGDGYDDLIIGAFSADPNGADSGASYVVFGGALGGSTTPVTTTGTAGGGDPDRRARQ